MFQTAHLTKLSATALLVLGLWGGINTVVIRRNNIGFSENRIGLNADPICPNEFTPRMPSGSPALPSSIGTSFQARGNRGFMPRSRSQHSMKNSDEARYLRPGHAREKVRFSELHSMEVSIEIPEALYQRATKLRERMMILNAPASRRGDALPFYLETVNLLRAFEAQQTGVSSVEEMTGNSKESNVRKDGRTAEINALLKACELFLGAMDAEPTHDPESSDYADWWEAARHRAENHLRLILGWDRFNTLSVSKIETIVNTNKFSPYQ